MVTCHGIGVCSSNHVPFASTINLRAATTSTATTWLFALLDRPSVSTGQQTTAVDTKPYVHTVDQRPLMDDRTHRLSGAKRPQLPLPLPPLPPAPFPTPCRPFPFRRILCLIVLLLSSLARLLWADAGVQVCCKSTLLLHHDGVGHEPEHLLPRQDIDTLHPSAGGGGGAKGGITDKMQGTHPTTRQTIFGNKGGDHTNKESRGRS